MSPTPFVPPPYPYDRLAPIAEIAALHDGGAIELSVGDPCDPPPPAAVAALGGSGRERNYPFSIGGADYRDAAAEWIRRRLGVELGSAKLAACVGTKEFVAGLPHLLRLRRPDLDTVLYPAVSYPSYAMGATLAGCRAVPVAVDDHWRIDLSTIDPADAQRALCLWVNTPGNPTGGLDDLDAVAEWGRANDVPVFSDECYVEFTWDGPRRTILTAGAAGVVAVHSLSKRSNLAGVRAGFYAGDADLVGYISEVRKHLGIMVPGPVQAAAVAAWSDDAHVDEQATRYRKRLQRLIGQLARLGLHTSMPGGAFYLWVAAPDGDAWALTERLAREVGVVASPGEFYGPAAVGHVRIAAVQPDEKLDLIDRRLEAAGL
ncbi:MAG TPA: pyridoxal phosphate-dependent aminotransferase [Microthrixaceae bacterium]|nr:aminotransferase class I/II-fold pyridoxal phosphate-dependent enzyme [Microthrixaceae bacterium]HNI34320.1 pyridoxal phosphate-dependent aminotransferase [Microthrixaceae bacterium]